MLIVVSYDVPKDRRQTCLAKACRRSCPDLYGGIETECSL